MNGYAPCNPQTRISTEGYFVPEGLTPEWDELMHPDVENNLGVAPTSEIPLVLPGTAEPETPPAQLREDAPSPPSPADFQAELERFEKLLAKDGLAAEFEKSLMPQLPTEASFEKAFRKQFAPEDYSNERLQRALETLNKHGVQEGLRRLTKSDPNVAKHFKTALNARQPTAR